MPEIRQLSPSVVNKIAAGEVIERPASVVKELVENSVDSGATRIDVSVEQGGSQLIRVVDNGCGIHADQLLLAVASHATSKIRDADDLFRVATLGFRGEALASIAEISQFRIVSRPPEASEAAELEVLGGEAQPIVPCGAPQGTTMEVRNLFFNTPVRRKFMRTVQTELGHLSEAFLRIALPHPHIHFTLRHNDRIVHDLPPVESWRERIIRCFGDELGENLIWVENRDEQIALSGYVANPSYNRANNRLQYLFLNGRFIRDRSLQHALSEAYRGLLMQGRFPVAMLRMDLPPEIVDVNVHPTKLEVRFQDGSRLYSQTLSTIRNRFLATDLTARVKPTSSSSVPSASGEEAEDRSPDLGQPRLQRTLDSGSPESSSSHSADLPARTADNSPREATSPAARDGTTWGRGGNTQRGFEYSSSDTSSTRSGYASTTDRFADRSVVAWARGGSSRLAGGQPGGHETEDASFPTTTSHQDATRDKLPSDEEEKSYAPGSETRDGATSDERGASSSVMRDRRKPKGLQIHDRYLVMEGEEGMVVIDQHALHERVLYEQLREKVLAGRIEMQRLLVPEPVTLSPVEAGMVLDQRETLAAVGIQIEPFGGDTVLVVGYPAMLHRFSPAEILRQAVDLLLSGNGQIQRRDLMDEMLHMMACKGAVKAGDPLSPEEIVSLLEHRELCLDAHHCPHGRPTALVFTREELDKRFGRI